MGRARSGLQPTIYERLLYGHVPLRRIRDGWLHTGDLGDLGPNGCLYIVDRIKTMLEVDGFRVAPLEVERVISRLDWIKQVQVAVEADPSGNEYLTALVVARPGTCGTEHELRGH